MKASQEKLSKPMPLKNLKIWILGYLAQKFTRWYIQSIEQPAEYLAENPDINRVFDLASELRTVRAGQDRLPVLNRAAPQETVSSVPPADWLKVVNRQSTPPAEWLAKVQKYAPGLLTAEPSIPLAALPETSVTTSPGVGGSQQLSGQIDVKPPVTPIKLPLAGQRTVVTIANKTKRVVNLTHYLQHSKGKRSEAFPQATKDTSVAKPGLASEAEVTVKPMIFSQSVSQEAKLPLATLADNDGYFVGGEQPLPKEAKLPLATPMPPARADIPGPHYQNRPASSTPFQLDTSSESTNPPVRTLQPEFNPVRGVESSSISQIVADSPLSTDVKRLATPASPAGRLRPLRFSVKSDSDLGKAVPAPVVKPSQSILNLEATPVVPEAFEFTLDQNRPGTAIPTTTSSQTVKAALPSIPEALDVLRDTVSQVVKPSRPVVRQSVRTYEATSFTGIVLNASTSKGDQGGSPLLEPEVAILRDRPTESSISVGNIARINPLEGRRNGVFVPTTERLEPLNFSPLESQKQALSFEIEENFWPALPEEKPLAPQDQGPSLLREWSHLQDLDREQKGVP
jgi:hypothetical protein